jgi:hypothetical protein
VGGLYPSASGSVFLYVVLAGLGWFVCLPFLSLGLRGASTADGYAALFDEAWRVTRDRFYDPGMAGLDWQAVGDKYRPKAEASSSSAEFATIINAMLAELGASHMGYFTPADPAYYQLADIFGGTERDDAKRFFDGSEVRYPGIGIFTREIEGRTFVSGVMEGLPGAAAYLRTGDEIVGVEGSPFEPVASFANKVGQPVNLIIRRNSDSVPRPLTVTPVSIQPNGAFLSAMRNSARIIESGGLKIGYGFGTRVRSLMGQTEPTDTEARDSLVQWFDSAKGDQLPFLVIPNHLENDCWFAKFALDTNEYTRDSSDKNTFPFELEEVGRGVAP